MESNPLLDAGKIVYRCGNFFGSNGSKRWYAANKIRYKALICVVVLGWEKIRFWSIEDIRRESKIALPNSRKDLFL